MEENVGKRKEKTQYEKVCMKITFVIILIKFFALLSIASINLLKYMCIVAIITNKAFWKYFSNALA